MRLSLAVALTYFLYIYYLFIFDAPPSQFNCMAFIFLAGFGAHKALRPIASRRSKEFLQIRGAESSLVRSTVVLVVSLLTGVILLRYTSAYANHPLGMWDAFAIWNVKAKFLIADHNWSNIFLANKSSHLDYPLLLPTVVALLWKLCGGAFYQVPLLLSVLFWVLTFYLVFRSVTSYCGYLFAGLAILILSSSSVCLSHFTTQYADAPLALYTLLAIFIASLALKTERNSNSFYSVVVGLIIGIPINVKNEGILTSISILFFFGLILLLTSKTHRLKKLFMISFGTLLAAIPVMIQKLIYFGETDLVTSNFSDQLGQLTDPQRWFTVAGLFLSNAQLVWGSWFIALLIFSFTVASALVFYRKLNFRPIALLALFLASSISAYYGVFLITPNDLHWHVETALPRLFFQLWPTLVFFVVITLHSLLLSIRQLRISRQRWLMFGCLVILVGQNLVIFRDHYFAFSGFTGDFLLSYQFNVSYWTSAISAGLFPDWVPQQSMGYPLAVNPQYYFFYPLNWIFSLPGLRYSMGAAVSLQCLHILLGSLGMFYLCRQLKTGNGTALVIAFGYQLSGVFYGSSLYPDIVRGFCWLPWLFASIQISKNQKYLSNSKLLIPLFSALFISGSYPGMVISVFALTALYLMVCLCHQRFSLYAVRQVGTIGLLLVLGILIASPHVGLSMLYSDELTRKVQAALTYKHSLSPGMWYNLIFSWYNPSFQGHQSSSYAIYTAIPILALSAVGLRNHWRVLLPLIVAATFSLGMITGSSSHLYTTITALVPFLGVSVFPISDYRVFIVLLIFISAAYGLMQIRRQPETVSVKHLIYLPLALIVFAGLGLFGLRVGLPQLIRALVVTLLLGASFKLWGRKSYLLLILMLLSAIDAGFVLTHGNKALPWKTAAENSGARNFLQYDSSAPLPVEDFFIHGLSSRSVRVQDDTAFLFKDTSRGLLDNSFHLKEHGNFRIKNAQHIFDTPLLLEYMKRPSSPLFLQTKKCAAVRKQVSKKSPQLVKVINYTNDTVTYDISQRDHHSGYLVDNEIYFKGWTATLLDKDGRELQRLEAVKVCKSLRGWKIPESPSAHYLVSSFELPERNKFLIVSFLAIGFWLTLLGWVFIKNRRLLNSSRSNKTK